ncbi:hypothetical protein PsorP6_009868 [Peronosclerospora sorghi]|uniref:Uncharacterized protein n=1 Tax=Peronosclerospora sorghi TaxID=230839 RepID=A0ACC0W1I0_9STRA|nr:hypothetical protein PsorP6_009868 [Peronosclerospora sorghi]
MLEAPVISEGDPAAVVLRPNKMRTRLMNHLVAAAHFGRRAAAAFESVGDALLDKRQSTSASTVATAVRWEPCCRSSLNPASSRCSSERSLNLM